MNVDKDTLIMPISLLGTVCGGVFYLSVMYADIEHNNQKIKFIQHEIEKINSAMEKSSKLIWENQMTIDRRLSRIEGKLDMLIKK